jgi:hypothetical protein
MPRRGILSVTPFEASIAVVMPVAAQPLALRPCNDFVFAS